MSKSSENFEASMARLDQIVKSLEKGDVPLSDTQILQSEVAYEKENQINVTGDKTVSDADALDQILLNLIMLDEAEQQVVKLMKGADGAPVEQELEHE